MNDKQKEVLLKHANNNHAQNVNDKIIKRDNINRPHIVSGVVKSKSNNNERRG